MSFRKRGFFHFVQNHADPLGELRRSLDREKAKESIEDSLIVLPEAFNIRKYYKANGDSDHDPRVLTDIQLIAGEFQVAFVVGVIISEEGGPNPPYSSAWLVDSDGSRLICRKKWRDGTTGEYTPCDAKYSRDAIASGKGHYVVFANSDTNLADIGSFVGQGGKVVLSETGAQNRVALW